MEPTYKNLNQFFDEALSELKCESDTRAYIVSIFSRYKTAEGDLSKDSITLAYAQAKMNQDFLSFQNLADWIFFSKTFAPGHLNNASEEYYQTIAQLSYNSCYRLIDRKWRLFEELSDNFVFLEKNTRQIIRSIIVTPPSFSI